MKSIGLDKLKTGYHYCMHGLGAVGGVRQTNTLEAFQRWYYKGVRVFEYDLAITEDKQYVAVAHTVDQKSMRRMEVLEIPESYSFDWFMQQRLFSYTTKGLTPLSLADVIRLLKENTDCCFMLDLFGMFTAAELTPFLEALDLLVAEDENVKSRLLLEAYNEEMAETIYGHSAQYNIIYCARYEGHMDGEAVSVAYLRAHGIEFVSYPWMYTEHFPEEIKMYTDAGMTVFSRTVFNTKVKALKKVGVTVNIVSYQFHGWKIIYEFPLYALACVKRILMKFKIKADERKR